jgi:hypothetical protein
MLLILSNYISFRFKIPYCKGHWDFIGKKMANVNTNILSLEGTNLIMLKESYSDSTRKFSETDIIKMLECLIDNIFAIFVLCAF